MVMMDESAASKSVKVKRRGTRSPNYPALNLANAIDRAKAVFEEFGRSRVGDEDVAQALGYAKLHGKSRSVVSALKKYGLLESDGDGFKISDNALDIFNLPSDHPDRTKAIRDASLRPALFSELHETYGDSPPGDSLIRNYLFKKNFNPNTADEVIRLYRDTMSFASQTFETYTSAEDPIGEQQETQMQQTQQTANARTDLSNPHVVRDSFEEFLEIPISKECRVRLSVDGPVTQEAIDKLIAYLNLGKDDLPSINDRKRNSEAATDEQNAADKWSRE